MRPLKILPTHGFAAAMSVCCRQQMRYRAHTGAGHTTCRTNYEYDRPPDREISAGFRRYYHSINPFGPLSIISRINRNEPVEADSLFVRLFRTAYSREMERYLVGKDGT